MQNAPRGAFCNAFDLYEAIIGLENQFSVFLRVAVLHRFNCIVNLEFVKKTSFTFIYDVQLSFAFFISSPILGSAQA